MLTINNIARQVITQTTKRHILHFVAKLNDADSINYDLNVLRHPFNYQAVDSGVLGELTPLTHGVSVKSSGSHKTDMLLSGSLLTVLQFPTLFERDGCDSFDTWHVHCADSEQDHQWVTGALLRPPSHCRRACVIPHTTWLRGINIDEKSVDIGIHSAR